jgi:hypothetical protein
LHRSKGDPSLGSRKQAKQNGAMLAKMGETRKNGRKDTFSQ